MEGLDLSSLEKNVVEEAVAASSASLVEQAPSVTAPEQAVIAAESTEIAPTDEIIPVDVPAEIEADPADVAKALENIESIIPTNEEVETPEEKPTNVYPALAAFLKEKNILDSKTEINDEESFVEAINKTIEDNKYANLSPAQKLYLEAIESGIDDISAKAIVKDIDTISRVDETMLSGNTELAEGLIEEDLIAQGWDANRIAKQIDRLRKTEELTSEGMVARENILNRNHTSIENSKLEAEQAKIDNKNREKDQLARLKDSVFNEKKALTVVNADGRLKNQVYEAMTKPVAYLENGQPINALTKDRQDNPVDFEKRLYYAYVLTNGFKDISRLQRRADSSAASKLKEAVQGLNIGMAGQGATVHTPKSDMPDIISV